MSLNPIIASREARVKLLENVERAHTTKRISKSQSECAHDFEIFKETIRPDNHFTRTAFFTVQGCLKCHLKRRINYTII